MYDQLEELQICTQKQVNSQNHSFQRLLGCSFLCKAPGNHKLTDSKVVPLRSSNTPLSQLSRLFYSVLGSASGASLGGISVVLLLADVDSVLFQCRGKIFGGQDELLRSPLFLVFAGSLQANLAVLQRIIDNVPNKLLSGN
eukprot:TRINITY_DN3805_c0_g2_i1.p1 TRINITY_DN3805_c0_g2~~TRINITY_DN3805_c0_g2_i1.p1  ORF type:complete len:141 (-),score=11.44 TRINITY_DN3805_c0_g2_i1:51-473(-)